MHLDVRSWLEAEGFGRFAELFESRQIDGDALPLLSDAHLQELGIPLGPRVKLLAAIERLTASASPAAERRRLTVMFVDLVGSTALASCMDPEDLRDLIRGYQEAITSELGRYQAHVARYLGDGALVYFGYPKAHEDDAERAVRAALGILRAVGALRSPAGEPLAAHIGIATGLVVVGDLLGAGAATERAVVGETPNLAKRLQDVAGPGEIVVSAQTRALTGNLFDWRDLGARTVKGVAEPVDAYCVIGERAVETRFEGRHGAQLAPMVGRDAELGLLLQRWQLARQGRGQLVVLTGEPGIGKSRIVRALEDAIAAEPHVRISNQCSPYHSDSALHPMIMQLSRAAGIEPTDSAAAQLQRLEQMLAGAEPNEVLLLASLLGIEAGARLAALDLTPEQQRVRTFEALLAQLVRVSATAPVLWVMEDAHWIDPTTLELVAQCVERISLCRVLAVVTARPEFSQDLGNRPVTRLALGRLQREDVTAMVSSLARGKSLPEAVVREIATRTDGVPLFVEELTKSLLEAGMLRETGDAYVFEGPARGLAVPASLHDSMMARLDRHAGLKEVAQVAACIGREFGHELLAAVCGMPEETLRAGLEGLEQAELVFRRGGGAEAQYLFKHALVRDAAYESLLKSRRQQIHGRVLAALERGGQAPAEILAQHAFEAGDLPKAIECWQRAGVLAIARPAYQEAISHLTQALRLAEQMGESRAWQERRLQLVLLVGQATIPLRGYSHSDTVTVFTRAQELIDSMENAPHRHSVSYAMWVAYYVRGEHAAALAIARDMRERAERDGSEGRMLTALRALGIAQMITGELPAARDTFVRAQKLAHVHQQQSREQRIAVAHRFAADPEIATQFHVALTLWALGDVDEAGAIVTKAIAAARSMGHVHTLGHALTHGAIFAAVTRDASGARRLSSETMVFADEHDMDLWRGYGAILHAYALVLAGESARAVAFMQRGFGHLERTQTGTMVPMCHAVHAYALASLGRFGDAAREAAIMQRELRTGSERYFWPEALHWIGDYRRLVPDVRPEEVEEAYSEGLSHAQSQHARSFELGAATALAHWWADRGQREKAIQLLEPFASAPVETIVAGKG